MITCLPPFFITSVNSASIPKIVSKGLSYPSACAAMLEEMNALDYNITWTLADLPTGNKAIGCKWVFVVKFNTDS